MIDEITIVSLILLLAWQEYSNRKERKSLVEAIMAKDLRELKEGEKMGRQKPSVETLPDLIPIDEASDRDFDMAIKKSLGREPLVEKIKDKIKGVN